MRVERLYLENFRNFKSLDIQFPDSDIIVLIGSNGSGKTTILDAIGFCLAHQSGQLTSQKDEYYIESSLSKNDIKNGEIKTIIKSDLFYNGSKIQITESKEIDQNGVGFEITPNNYFSEIRKQLILNNSSVNLPLLVYYRANRTSIIENDLKPNIYYNKRLEGYQFSFNSIKSSFNLFESWFLHLENIENEGKVNNKDFNFEFQGLKIIRHALTEFMSRINNANYFNLRGVRSEHSGNGFLAIQKGETVLKLAQLSMGEKMLLYIVSDIARRLVILNDFDNLSLFKDGVVLIDELELHLHPEWQRRIVNALRKTFPGIQFIVTTHSPQILSNLTDHEIVVLKKEHFYTPSTNPLGRDTNGILEEVFDVPERPVEVSDLIKEIFKLISKNSNAKDTIVSKLENLKKMVSEYDPILIKLNNILDRIH